MSVLATGGGGGTPRTIKTANDVGLTSAVYADDAEVSWQVEPGKYHLEFFAKITNVSGAAYLSRFTFTGGLADANAEVCGVGHLSNATVASYLLTTGSPHAFGLGVSSVAAFTHVGRFVFTVTSTGTLALNHRNNNGVGTSTRKANSIFILRPI